MSGGAAAGSGGAPAAPVTPVRRRALVRGLVQGVSFRVATQAEARRRNVVGWVRNLPDGSVEVEAQGAPEAVEALLTWCRQGPRHARVDAVEIEVRELVFNERDLLIKHG
jgi:acylphosphatase